MTEIIVFRKNGRIAGFEASGHTGYAESGEDIVCAAVSAITQTAVLGITDIVKCPAAFEREDGKLCFMLDKSVKGKSLEQAELILGTMLTGLRSVKNEYSKYIKLTEREV